METVLIEIEAVINSRPLTYLYDDDITEPLTPSHLLSGRNMFQKCAENSASSVISVDIGKRARCVQRAVQLFWNKFKQCYLAELREHHMYQNKGNKNNDDKLLKVNDVVLVKGRYSYTEEFLEISSRRFIGCRSRWKHTRWRVISHIKKWKND